MFTATTGVAASQQRHAGTLRYSCLGCRCVFVSWQVLVAHEAICPVRIAQTTMWTEAIARAKARDEAHDARIATQRQRRADNRAYKKQRLALIGRREASA
jgi:hypothetical protein